MQAIFSFAIFATLLVSSGLAHEDHDLLQMPLDYVKYPWQAKAPSPMGHVEEGMACSSHIYPCSSSCAVTADSIFSGITTFARLPWSQCLGKDKDDLFDIAFLGAPFVS